MCVLLCSGPKMVAVRNYHGTPAPPGKTPLCFQTGDYIELLKGDPDTTWWEVFHKIMKLHNSKVNSVIVVKARKCLPQIWNPQSHSL